MKKFFLLCFVLLCAVHKAGAQKPLKGKWVFYLVRHAEKDTGSNPVLSVKGMQRAGDLHRALQAKKIQLIMATQYRRTGLTADSIRLYRKIDSIQYKADADGSQFLKTLQARAGNARAILVVGHSNTLPAIIRQLGVKGYSIKELPETEYNNLFIVTIRRGRAKLHAAKYGAE